MLRVLFPGLGANSDELAALIRSFLLPHLYLNILSSLTLSALRVLRSISPPDFHSDAANRGSYQ